MKKVVIAVVILVIGVSSSYAQKIKSSKLEIGFFSSTPVEDIEALSKTGVSIIDTSNNQIAFSVKNTSFVFPNSLMQEHFNEKYMESNKFPQSSFSGVFLGAVDWNKEGVQKVNVQGTLNIHGVAMPRSISVTLNIKNGKVSGTTEFKVRTSDHKIEIPKIVWEKIAEEIKVTVNAVY
jgi:polyisoprenoid-binding protein YceI